MIIPIGLVIFDEESKKFLSDSIDYQPFAETKRMEKNRKIDRVYEAQVLGNYNREEDYHTEDDNFYDRREFKRKG